MRRSADTQKQLDLQKQIGRALITRPAKSQIQLTQMTNALYLTQSKMIPN